MDYLQVGAIKIGAVWLTHMGGIVGTENLTWEGTIDL
jgi:hypothetical protein